MRSKKVEIIKEILRLKEAGQNNSEIHRITGADRKTIITYLNKFQDLNLDYAAVKKLESSKIRSLLFPEKEKSNKPKLQPDWKYIYQESQRKNVTLQQLWYEFKEANPEGISYSRFTEYFKQYRKTLDVSMVQVHKLGEKCFVDFTGLTVPIVESKTGEVFNAEIFASALGGSSRTFAYSVADQSIANWIRAHIKMFEFYGGVTEIIVPDNLKSGVNKACRYDPVINKSYQDLVEYYGLTVLPARVRKPQDKSKVEIAVQMIQRALAAYRDHTFFSLNELNQVLEKIVKEINEKPFQKLPGSRQSVFEEEKKHLKPLPQTPYEPTEWKIATVHKDYHIQYDSHFYSVPNQYISKKVEICASHDLVKIFYDNKSIAVHKRSYQKWQYTTNKEHRPTKHQKYLEWTPERIKAWAEKEIGPNTGKVVGLLLNSKPNPEITYRKCLGIIRLPKNFNKERVENASRILLESGIGTNPYQSLQQILKKNLDKAIQAEETASSFEHENIRGKESFA